MNKSYSSRMSLDAWISFFNDFIVPDDLSDDVIVSLLKYIADLAVLVPCEGNMWEWRDCNSHVDPEGLKANIQRDLESLCDSDSGFALPYFIGYKEIVKTPLALGSKNNQTDKGASKNYKNSEPLKKIKPASDLSNLQIVKKVGKQLQPFLKIEESIVSRLMGKHVSKQDAQKLFHYMFGKMGTKAEPRIWEQLSRKRHR
jgi:hypothetical protein